MSTQLNINFFWVYFWSQPSAEGNIWQSEMKLKYKSQEKLSCIHLTEQITWWARWKESQCFIVYVWKFWRRQTVQYIRWWVRGGACLSHVRAFKWFNILYIKYGLAELNQVYIKSFVYMVEYVGYSLHLFYSITLIFCNLTDENVQIH